MNILVVSAMQEELDPLLKSYDSSERIETTNNQNLYKVKINSKINLFLGTIGIGKVNATFNTQKYIEELKPKLVINIGTAGAVADDLNILDIVVGNKFAYHDVDLEKFGHVKGKIPGQDLYVIPEIDDKIKKLLNKREDIFLGTILTGDKFISSLETKETLKMDFENVYAVEMESTAIADVSTRLNTPVLILRGISDKASGESDIEFYEYLEKVMTKFRVIIDEIIKVVQDEYGK